MTLRARSRLQWRCERTNSVATWSRPATSARTAFNQACSAGSSRRAAVIGVESITTSVCSPMRKMEGCASGFVSGASEATVAATAAARAVAVPALPDCLDSTADSDAESPRRSRARPRLRAAESFVFGLLDEAEAALGGGCRKSGRSEQCCGFHARRSRNRERRDRCSRFDGGNAKHRCA